MNTNKVLSIFSMINGIPRPSHHEELVADFLCRFASERSLEFKRDAQNCVVIRKPARKGCENAPTIVLLNHMDMVAVGDGSRPFNPLKDGIEAYCEDGWMKARGTSLGADNGIGLSMALAVLDEDSIVHGPIEVLTTTNEEDGMSGAQNLSKDFISGRLVINLDSEDYDTITVGAAGAYLQLASFPIVRTQSPQGYTFFKLTLSGGLGGHSGVDINKNRINANVEICRFLSKQSGIQLVSLDGGSANASIAASCSAVIGISTSHADCFANCCKTYFNELIGRNSSFEPGLKFEIQSVDRSDAIIAGGLDIVKTIARLPFGVIRMHPSITGTVMTSNNVGVVCTCADRITVSCHTRSFDDAEMVAQASAISSVFKTAGATVQVMMNAPGWQEKQDSEFLTLVDKTFADIIGFSPRKVAMHFVLEAGYYVQKYPGIQIACIGPRIVEPHSTSERVELSTVNDIWNILLELLRRLGSY